MNRDRLNRVRKAVAEAEEAMNDALERAVKDGHDVAEARRLVQSRFRETWRDLDRTEALMTN